MGQEPQQTILIVNDLPDQIELLKNSLRRAAYRIHTATSAADAFQIAHEVRPDLIISDVSMPEIDGIEFCKMIQTDEALKTIPVLLVSAVRKDSASVAEGLRTGAFDYLEAPYDPDKLSAKVERLLEINSTIRSLREGETFVEREKLLQAIIDTEPECVKVLDREGILLSMNPAGLEMVEADSPDQVIGQCIYAFIAPEHLEKFKALMELIGHGRSGRLEFEILGLKGGRRLMETHAAPLRDQQNEIFGLVAVTRDISEQRQAEKALRENLTILTGIIEGTSDAVFVKDTESRYLLINSAGARLVGKSPEEIVGKDDTAVFPPETAQRIMGFDRQMILSGEGQTYEGNVTAGDLTRTYLTAKTPYRNEQGEIIGLIGIARDISSRKQMEKALRESEARYRLLFDNNPLPMWVVDLETLAFLAVNEAATRHYGYSNEEFLSMTVKDIRLEESDQETSCASGAGTQRLCRDQKKDGSIIDVEVIAHEITFDGRRSELVLTIDITERERSKRTLSEREGQHRQIQRLEAIGQLAGGVAHDFNNLLTVISGYSALILRQVEPGSLLRHQAEEIRKAAERAAGLTHQLLAFSRKQVLQPKVLDLNSLVANMGGMLRRLIGEHVDLAISLTSDLARINADQGQIEQVIMNLVVNARDAMPGGGKIVIETSNTELDASYTEIRGGVKPGHYVMLAVSDSGCGIDEEKQKHIFEPFFTTKGVGKGTGLGLSTVYGIVKQSGGNVWVYSTPGMGTSFKVYLPAMMESVAPQEAVEPPPISRGTETVLLVEDETMVRALARSILKGCGYNVLEAASGEEAIRICKQHANPIQLMLTDVVMPGMSGREMARRLADVHPEMGVLYMSGYTDDAIVHHGVLDADTPFLEKPFTPDALARKVREVLNSVAAR